MLAEWQLKRLESEDYEALIPVLKHLSNVQLVGVVRLRYRPQTEATALWLKRASAQWAEWAKRYSDIEVTIRGLSSSNATSRLDQGEIKDTFLSRKSHHRPPSGRTALRRTMEHSKNDNAKSDRTC
jgi:hypothetical protein